MNSANSPSVRNTSIDGPSGSTVGPAQLHTGSGDDPEMRCADDLDAGDRTHNGPLPGGQDDFRHDEATVGTDRSLPSSLRQVRSDRRHVDTGPNPRTRDGTHLVARGRQGTGEG